MRSATRSSSARRRVDVGRDAIDGDRRVARSARRAAGPVPRCRAASATRSQRRCDRLVRRRRGPPSWARSPRAPAVSSSARSARFGFGPRVSFGVRASAATKSASRAARCARLRAAARCLRPCRTRRDRSGVAIEPLDPGDDGGFVGESSMPTSGQRSTLAPRRSSRPASTSSWRASGTATTLPASTRSDSSDGVLIAAWTCVSGRCRRAPAARRRRCLCARWPSSAGTSRRRRAECDRG